jgi:hypothetical protein
VVMAARVEELKALPEEPGYAIEGQDLGAARPSHCRDRWPPAGKPLWGTWRSGPTGDPGGRLVSVGPWSPYPAWRGTELAGRLPGNQRSAGAVSIGNQPATALLIDLGQLVPSGGPS